MTTRAGSSLLVIVPARDESATVDEVVSSVQKTIRPDAIVVVADRCRDETALVAELAGATVLQTGLASGLGAAMNVGISHGINEGFSRFATIDADGQYDAEDLRMLIDRLNTGPGGLVIGNRVAAQRPTGMRWSRYIANRVFNCAFGAYVRLDRIDAQSGLRAFDLDTATTCMTTNTFTYTQEQVLRAVIHARPIESVDIRFHQRRVGQSRLVKSLPDYVWRTIPHLVQVSREFAITEAEHESVSDAGIRERPSTPSTPAFRSLPVFGDGRSARPYRTSAA